ncbi:GNAT family N-acetyltransferase [Plantibacter sp. Mn2098]|uniref:GNAT family N-acetyltransferase n=1 Tax=Plantibacter sp. Mn2098 TaxID=3395266 RepID=UPI003BDDE71A
MLQFVQVPVDVEPAVTLLSEYFTSRELGFVSDHGAYKITHPDPAAFTPPAGVFVVLEEDGAPLGCGGIRRIQDAPDGAVQFEIKHLFLRPETRGRGLGRSLLAELERLAVGFGATRFVLDTNASLTAAGGLYRSSGYLDVPAYNDNPNATNWYAKDVASA